MPEHPHNDFGPNVPLDDLALTLTHLGIQEGDRVLDVGGAANPFQRANVVCDLTFASSAQRNGAPTVFREDVRYVEAPAEALPFEDDSFDFVYCTQVLEHVLDPVRAASELCRVARRGFVEVPSRMGELLFGNPTHRWIVDRDERGLTFHRRPFIEHPLQNFLYGDVLNDLAFRRLSEVTYRNLFNHQVLFEGELRVRIAAGEERFCYDTPDHAARSHFSFARNVFARSRDAEYVYPEALEAARMAPTSSAAQRLLAVVQATLGRTALALQTLAPLTDEKSVALTALLLAETTNPASLPLPSELSLLDEGNVTTSKEARPLVSVIVAATTADDLRRSVESALAQDYPRVEVVATTSLKKTDADVVLKDLVMGDRLVVQTHEGLENVAALLNRGCLTARGELIAFLVSGERYSSHHLDCLVAHVVTSGGVACHSDRLLVTGEGVVGPEILADDPETASASLSTLLSPRAVLLAVGALDEALFDQAPVDYLRRLARTTRLHHVREVTVLSRGPLSAPLPALDAAEAAKRVSAELVRSLMAAHVREEGLRARIQTLEAEVATFRKDPS